LNNAPLLVIENLSIGFQTESGLVAVTDNVSFEVGAAQVMGLAGESGCGKTITALSILRLLPQPSAQILSGTIFFKGEAILSMPRSKLYQLRGKEISMIFQEPSAALDPLMPIGKQIEEMYASHPAEKEGNQRIAEILNRVGFSDPERIKRAFPHQLSGGMLQRVMIAMAVLLHPSLIIADEPTTALDVTVQAQIMELLAEMQRETGTSVILITHNLGLIAQYANSLAIMYAGRIAETASCAAFFEKPLHPYSQGLIAALPDLHATKSSIEPIPGQVPQPRDFESGCRFRQRCRFAFDECVNKPPFYTIGDSAVACFLYKEKSDAAHH